MRRHSEGPPWGPSGSRGMCGERWAQEEGYVPPGNTCTSTLSSLLGADLGQMDPAQEGESRGLQGSPLGLRNRVYKQGTVEPLVTLKPASESKDFQAHSSGGRAWVLAAYTTGHSGDSGGNTVVPPGRPQSA